MKKLWIVVIALCAAPLFAQSTSCTGENIQARSATAIAVTLCDVTLATGDTVTVSAGGQDAQFTVTGTGVNLVANPKTYTLAAADASALKVFDFGTVQITAGGTKRPVRVLSLFENYRRHSASAGPANADTAKGGATGSSTAALGLQYDGEYARGGILGTKTPPIGVDATSGAAYQTRAAISIDTTDQTDPSFVDDNRLTLGARRLDLDFGSVYSQGSAGFDVRVGRAFHRDVRDVDAVAVVAGQLPFVPSYTFASNTRFIAQPLTFTASYGYRNRHDNATSVHGTVFEGSALYHLYLYDAYAFDVSGTWTINSKDLQNATTPRTQRMFRAKLLYLANPKNGFSLLTTVENGSAGVMLRSIRQYFIGMSISKFGSSSK